MHVRKADYYKVYQKGSFHRLVLKKTDKPGPTVPIQGSTESSSDRLTASLADQLTSVSCWRQLIMSADQNHMGVEACVMKVTPWLVSRCARVVSAKAKPGVYTPPALGSLRTRTLYLSRPTTCTAFQPGQAGSRL